MSFRPEKTCKDNAGKPTNRLWREKIFIHRQSYYNTLLENDHLRSVYYFVVSIFIIMCLNIITSDLLIHGKIYLGIRTLRKGFGKFDVALTTWAAIHVPILGLHYALNVWMQTFRNLKQSTALQRLWNYSSIIAYASFQFYLFYDASRTCAIHDLPFATSGALVMETLRLSMKTYAFVRTNVSKVLTNDLYELAPVSSYVYYIFAPTFIYRDSYPRTNKINWILAIKNLIEVVLAIFLIAFLFERCMLPIIQDFGLKRFTLVELFHGFFSLIMPSTLILFTFHRMILHSWLNFTAEILCFGDRMYHSDWWTSTNYRRYYRTWNTVVHEWLYEFIYKESSIYIYKNSLNCCTLTVIYLSAFLHEFIFVITLRMFYPVSFFMFGGMGSLVVFHPKNLSKRVGNVFFLLTLQIGFALIIYMYALEYYARKNTTQLQQMHFIEQLSAYPVSWKILGQTYS